MNKAKFVNSTNKIIKPKLFKEYDISTLYHVGTMDICKKRNFSYEGNGLSVSICPDEWETITRNCESGLWALTKENSKFLDYYSLTKSQKEVIINWALDKKYFDSNNTKEVYNIRQWNEDGEEYYIGVNSYEEALQETSYYNENNEEDREYEKERIKPVKVYLPTKRLRKEMLVEVDNFNAMDFVIILYVEKVLKLDGIYWDDELDVYSYSAPKAVIFNSTINTFDIKAITEEDKPCWD